MRTERTKKKTQKKSVRVSVCVFANKRADKKSQTPLKLRERIFDVQRAFIDDDKIEQWHKIFNRNWQTFNFTLQKMFVLRIEKFVLHIFFRYVHAKNGDNSNNDKKATRRNYSVLMMLDNKERSGLKITKTKKKTMKNEVKWEHEHEQWTKKCGATQWARTPNIWSIRIYVDAVSLETTVHDKDDEDCLVHIPLNEWNRQRKRKWKQTQMVREKRENKN